MGTLNEGIVGCPAMMEMRKIAHISDLHFGAADEQVAERLVESIDELRPDLAVVSGDLTQRARPSQFREARAFLDRLKSFQLIVPGNHDVPLYNVVGRFEGNSFNLLEFENTSLTIRRFECISPADLFRSVSTEHFTRTDQGWANE